MAIAPSAGDRPLAVVVGAGGMAMWIAQRLAATHRILLADRDPAALDRGVAALNAHEAVASGLACDVTDQAAVEALAARAAALGGLRALAHVVGLSPSMGDWSRVLSVNLIGAALVDEAFLTVAEPGMAALFVASMAGHSARPTPEQVALMDDPLQSGLVAKLEATLADAPSPQLAYSLSKFALIRRVQQRAAAWGARGARIVSLSPGMIETPMGLMEFENQPMKKVLLDASPIPRQGRQDEIVDAAEFLLSDRASFVTGTDLLVDGGVTAAMRHRA